MIQLLENEIEILQFFKENIRIIASPHFKEITALLEIHFVKKKPRCITYLHS